MSKSISFKNYFVYPLFLLVISLGYILLNKPAKDEPPAYIILIGMDTLRADHLSCYGYQKFIFNYDSPKESALFDLASDPLEKSNMLSFYMGKTGLKEFIEPLNKPIIGQEECLDFKDIDEGTKSKLKGLGYIQ